MGRNIKDEQGFLMVEIVQLLILATVFTGLFVTMGKFMRAHMYQESRLTAAYLLDGALDQQEYLGEYGNLVLGQSEQRVELNGCIYNLTLDVVEQAPGLVLVQGRVEWQRENHKFSLALARKILQGGKGSIPYGAHGTDSHPIHFARGSAVYE